MATTALFHDDDTVVERQSLCLSGLIPGIAIHAGEPEFKAIVEKNFLASENNTTERLLELKAELRTLDTEAFWNRLMEGLAGLCHAQFGFVSKRILVDDHDSAVEMPLIGEVGSCLMGVALYYNDGKENKNMSRDYKYYAWGAPCSYMRHDKIFLVPEGLSSFITENPNQLPFECDAYLGLPLFADGKCFAHFGLMWTKEGLVSKKNLSWGYLEMLLHSLEDMITARLLSGQGFAKSNVKQENVTETPEAPVRVISQDLVTAAQSLKPYAKSLSHELRTPMQGVVGMLDVMYATVQEQIEEQSSQDIRRVFQALKDNIETVQDSSKRAVEAADNVVYAYDLNMQIPETPSHDLDTAPAGQQSYFDSRPKMTQGSNIVNPLKRRRSSSNSWSFGNSTKTRHVQPSTNETRPDTPGSPFTRSEQPSMNSPKRSIPLPPFTIDTDRFEFPRPSSMTPAETDLGSTPGVRQCSIRDLIPVVIHDALRVGGRPDSAISEPTTLGEKIEVRSRSSSGYSSQKIVEWSVDGDVPEVVAMDERDLSKLITAVFLNAVKFTENGIINLRARLSANARFVLVNVADTGSGIPHDFQPELFKPFAKEDHSITRSKEGLGLGLLVAKGLARRTGGDIVLVRSTTIGPDHGTEFEIRVPIQAGEQLSQPSTPFNKSPDRAIPRSTPLKPTPSGPTQNIDKRTPPPIRTSPDRKNGAGMSSISKLISAANSQDQGSVPLRKSSIRPKPPLTTHDSWDRNLADKYPLKFLVAEDNKLNRKLLVSMLGKFGYKNVLEAYDGREAVRVMDKLLQSNGKSGDLKGIHDPPVDVILMDLWMPEMDGYEATEKILAMFDNKAHGTAPIVLAVSADVTEQAVDRATRTGMQGYMTKPYKLIDLQRLIIEFCASKYRG